MVEGLDPLLSVCTHMHAGAGTGACACGVCVCVRERERERERARLRERERERERVWCAQRRRIATGRVSCHFVVLYIGR